MWWLFGHKSEEKTGKLVNGVCPHCNKQTQCQEIIKSSETNVWFVPITSGENISGYTCLRCGNQFESFAITPKEGQAIGGCLVTLTLTIFIMWIMFAAFGFSWLILLGIPITGFILYAMTLKPEKSMRQD